MTTLLDTKKIRVLVVEDEPIVRNLMVDHFREVGYQVEQAGTGQQALSILKDEEFDLVTLDLELPDTKGITILKDIRSRKNQIDLPVVAITLHDNTEFIVDVIKAGANDYITKPLNFAVIDARTETLLTNKALHEYYKKKTQVHSIGAMVTTYNHEINNPMSVLLATLDELCEEHPHQQKLATSRDAALRIAEVVKKIANLDYEDLQQEAYGDHADMITLK